MQEVIVSSKLVRQHFKMPIVILEKNQQKSEAPLLMNPDYSLRLFNGGFRTMTAMLHNEKKISEKDARLTNVS